MARDEDETRTIRKTNETRGKQKHIHTRGKHKHTRTYKQTKNRSVIDTCIAHGDGQHGRRDQRAHEHTNDGVRSESQTNHHGGQHSDGTRDKHFTKGSLNIGPRVSIDASVTFFLFFSFHFCSFFFCFVSCFSLFL